MRRREASVTVIVTSSVTEASMSGATGRTALVAFAGMTTGSGAAQVAPCEPALPEIV